MKKETQEKLMKAISHHNNLQTNEQDKLNVQEVLTEIANLDNEELETAAKQMQTDLETRNKEK